MHRWQRTITHQEHQIMVLQIAKQNLSTSSPNEVISSRKVSID